LPLEKVQAVLTLTMTSKPAETTHWTFRTMAKQVSISRTAVHRIWREHQLKPHRVKGFKVSKAPQFEEKLREVIGMYLDPPEKRRQLCFPLMKRARFKRWIARSRVYR
jgi:hypothetical protein